MPDLGLLVLGAVVLIMAAVSASIGPAGGVVFAVVAAVLPAPAVVPVHAALQLGGTSIRLGLLRRYVDLRVLGAFAAGSVAGFAPAAMLASHIELPPDLLRCGLGLATIGPVLLRNPVGAAAGTGTRRLRPLAVLGGWSSFLALFVGATGPVVGAVLSRSFADPRRRVAVLTSCIWLQHAAKVAIYTTLGFSIRQYLPLLGFLLGASAVGAVVGRRVLTTVSAPGLTTAFEIVVVGIGAYLFATATGSMVVARL